MLITCLLYPPEASGGYFGLVFTTPPMPHIHIFGVKALRGKLHQLGSPNLQDIFIGGVTFSGTENSLILKKQDGRRRHFFENNLHFSTGCFSQVEG